MLFLSATGSFFWPPIPVAAVFPFAGVGEVGVTFAAGTAGVVVPEVRIGWPPTVWVLPVRAELAGSFWLSEPLPSVELVVPLVALEQALFSDLA